MNYKKWLLLWTLGCLLIVAIVLLTIKITAEDTVTAFEYNDWYGEPFAEESDECTPNECEPDGYETVIPIPSSTDAELIAQILYHECGALPPLEQSAVVWTILNRVDSELSYFPDTIAEVCTQKIGKYYMFAYREDAPVREDLYELAMDVMTRWYREKAGEENVGRTLPVEYVYFWGNGKHNFFRIEYQGKDYWDWSLPNPYAVDEP